MDKIKPLAVGMSTAGELLDCGDDALYDLIWAGEVDSYLEGNRRKITYESLEALVKRRLAATANAPDAESRRGRYRHLLRESKPKRGRPRKDQQIST